MKGTAMATKTPNPEPPAPSPESRAPSPESRAPSPKLRVRVRWMIRRDMREVLAIEAAGFEFPWSEANFIDCLRQRNCIGMVAEREDRVVGFLVYELHTAKVHFLNLAVAADCRRRGVGTQLVGHVTGRLSRRRMVCEVRETNMPALLFFRSLGFRAVSVLRGYYEETEDDAYCMVREHGGTV